MELKRGEILKSGNFILVSRVDSINELIFCLMNNKSIFWRHRMYPSAFILHQPLIVLINNVNGGLFWNASKTEKYETEQIIKAERKAKKLNKNICTANAKEICESYDCYDCKHFK